MSTFRFPFTLNQPENSNRPIEVFVSAKFFSFTNSEQQLAGRHTSSPLWPEHTLKVKFMHRGLEPGRSTAGLLRQFPGCFPQWQNCLFDFDPSSREYDWLVVYHDLPPSGTYFTEEKLACPKEKTIFITGEPSTITIFGRDYLNQFGAVLTFQEPWAIKHPNAIFHHPGLIWYYGLPFSEDGNFITWDQMRNSPLPRKTKQLATVCSQRRGDITLHSARVDFTSRLKGDLPELDVYGHGVLPMNDKAEALDPYRFHIAIENHVYPHHLTEKLPDAFLGYTLPFYHGAPNAADYFPEESFIPINISDYPKTLEIIRYHLNNNEYQDRLPYIEKARQLVLEEQNIFAILSREINRMEKTIPTNPLTPGKVIRNRSTMRIKNPIAGIRSLAEKNITMAYHWMTSKKRKR